MGKYKKKLAWLLMFALCVGTIAFPDSGKVMPVRAAEETTQTEKQVTFDGGVLKIDGVVIVTSEVLAGIDLQEIRKIEFGTSVKKIADGVFENCHNLVDVTWVDVAIIGKNAFAGCENLDIMTLPFSCTTIGEGAFWGCSKVEFVMLQSINKIGKNAFPLETNIVWKNVNYLPDIAEGFWQQRTGTMFIFDSSVWESVREENSQETIRWEEENFDAAYFTFNNPLDETKYYVYSRGSDVLRVSTEGTMTLESGIKKDERSFYIPTQIEIPKTSIKQWILKADNLTFNEKYKEYSNLQSVKVFGVVSVGEECFSGCSALETFEADKFTSIGQKAFYGCTSLEKIQIKEGIDSIGKSAFEGCKSLTDVVIETRIITIEKRVFYGCEKLQNVELPICVRKINQEAFGNCSSLKSIVLPENISYVGLGNFTTTDIYWKGDEVTLQTPEEGEAEFFEQVTGTMFIPTGSAFWQKQKERYPNISWQEWTPVIEQVETETYDLMEQWAFQDDPYTVSAEPWLDEEGTPCVKIHFSKKYQRIAFRLPDKIRAQDYASVSIKAKVGGQLMFELSVDDIRMDESQGAVGGLTADCAYPFYYDGEEGETKFGTEEVELKNASNDMTSYMLLGTCRDPEDVEVYGRKYEFYIYSITFNPISSGTKKYVFEKKTEAEETPSPSIQPTETPVSTISPTGLPSQTPSAAPENIAPSFSHKPEKSPAGRPMISFKKKGHGNRRYIQVSIKSTAGRYFDLYMKKKGKKYVRIRLKKMSLKKGKRVVKLKYTKKGYTVCFKVRTYDMIKGRKRYGAYSKEKRIKL